jgi:hypothetical protein
MLENSPDPLINAALEHRVLGLEIDKLHGGHREPAAWGDARSIRVTFVPSSW